MPQRDRTGRGPAQPPRLLSAADRVQGPTPLVHLLAACASLCLEGIVAKRTAASQAGGRSTTGLKIETTCWRAHRRLEACPPAVSNVTSA
jgi:hypothetical protein